MQQLLWEPPELDGAWLFAGESGETYVDGLGGGAGPNVSCLGALAAGTGGRTVGDWVSPNCARAPPQLSAITRPITSRESAFIGASLTNPL
jgi:hypothetical protein